MAASLIRDLIIEKLCTVYDPEIPVLHKAALSYSESVPVMLSDIRP